MQFPWKMAPEIVCVAGGMWAQWVLAKWATAWARANGRSGAVPWLRCAAWATSLWIGVSSLWGNLAGLDWVTMSAPEWMRGGVWLEWVRGTSLVWLLSSVGLLALLWLYRSFGGAVKFDPGRRKLLTGAGGIVLASPFAAAGMGVVAGRTGFQLFAVDVPIAGLPEDLDGLRVAQLSDIHLGPFLEEEELAWVVGMANETRPHLTVVTGDLITSRDDRLSDCLRLLARLKAEAGVLGCLGNHEITARCEARAKQEGARLGLDFLRGEARALRFGQATLNVAGVDYQKPNRPYLPGAEQMRREDAVNLLLSHNPDVFDVAALQRWDLTLAGHTHGGQVTVGFLNQYLNVARFLTPYVCGLYRRNGSAIYVTRGIGTVGVPARIGAPPEVTLIRLCAT